LPNAGSRKNIRIKLISILNRLAAVEIINAIGYFLGKRSLRKYAQKGCNKPFLPLLDLGMLKLQTAYNSLRMKRATTLRRRRWDYLPNDINL